MRATLAVCGGAARPQRLASQRAAPTPGAPHPPCSSVIRVLGLATRSLTVFEAVAKRVLINIQPASDQCVFLQVRNLADLSFAHLPSKRFGCSPGGRHTKPHAPLNPITPMHHSSFYLIFHYPRNINPLDAKKNEEKKTKPPTSAKPIDIQSS